MELIERDEFLSLMQKEFERVSEGEGHCLLVSGEAGIGKTSLVKAFGNIVKQKCRIYQGTCDALFTPRPLGPILDIIYQMHGPEWENIIRDSDRSSLFARLLYELENQRKTTIIIIEDIHWADEATLDFIKFFARRITRIRCLFILTFRDDEIHIHHPLRTVLGHLSPDFLSRLQLAPLSPQAVERLSLIKGYKGEDVYSISGGNPFYVNEILASYSTGIPDNIKDSILSVYNRQREKTKEVWQILSVIPTGFEMKYIEKMEPSYLSEIHGCLDSRILMINNGLVYFKHELYRRTIETSLSPLIRIELNRKILDILLKNFEEHRQTERIVHHAKNANVSEVVVKYAPLAARQAAAMGAHAEASKLYLSAIEYYQAKDKELLNQFYEHYAYECYLTNQIKESIIYSEKSLKFLVERNDVEKIGTCMRFLSRLWWFEANRKKAESYAIQAIDIMANLPPSKAKAMVFSNMSQLKMLSDQRQECIFWGEKAISMAKELGDEETLSHALNNVGTMEMRARETRQNGIELLQQSREIALKNCYEEHAARAYINLGSNAIQMKDYAFAKKILEEGIQYCEERDLDVGKPYLIGSKAQLALETGDWNEACRLAESLIKNENHSPIVRIGALVVASIIKMRKGEGDALPLLMEAKEKAFETMEQQRIVPVMIAILEFEWITGTNVIDQADLDHAITMANHSGNLFERSEFGFWLFKARKQKLSTEKLFEGYELGNHKMASKAASVWRQLGCPYEQALALFESSEQDKKIAAANLHRLGALAIFEKIRAQMRTLGIKSIPRGMRKSTSSNPANLTTREVDVLQLLKEGLPNKEIAARLFISPKTVDHHVTAIFFKLDVNSRKKAVQEAVLLDIL